MGKSKLLIAVLIGFLGGIFFGDLFKASLVIMIGLFLGSIVAIVIFWQERFWRLIIFGLVGVLLGLGFIQTWQSKQAVIRLPFNQEIEVTGPVIGHPDFQGAKATYMLKIRDAKVEFQTGRYPEYQYGDILKIKGTIMPPSPYLSHRNILGQIQNGLTQKIGYDGNITIKTIYRLRDSFENSLNQIFKEPLASFAAGLILGSKRNIPDSLMVDFNRTGTTHIVAVSGYNLTIVIIYLGLLLGLVSRRLKIWGSLVLIILFVLMTGASASVVRAGILAGLVIFGKSQGRRANMLILILLTATIMAVLNPHILKYDVSFQLSFLAFIGLVYLSPVMANFKMLSFLHPLIKQPLVETLGAQVMVLPILIYYFGQMSLVAPIVNVLILWLVPAAMLAIFLSGISGLLLIEIGHLVGLVTTYLLKYIILVVEGFSKISYASLMVKTSQWWWLPIYFLVISWLIYAKKPKPKEIL